MLPVETIGNPQLESECLAGRILHGNINSPNYLNLRMGFAGLSYIDASQELTDKLNEIKKMVIGTQGLVDRPIIKQYYNGEAKELKSLVEETLTIVDNLAEIYVIATPQKYDEIYSNLENDVENAPMTFEDLGEHVNRYSADSNHLQQLDQTTNELKRMQGVLQAILRTYGEETPKITNKEIPAKLSNEYKIFLNDLTNNLEVATDNVLISMTVSKGMDAIISTFPKDELDPYLTDVCNNIIETLTDPENFYSKCKSDGIVSSAVGQMFGHCYPEYYNKFMDMFMDEYEKMDYQQVLDFRKCFGLDSNDSELTSLCSLYVKLGFTSPQ